MAFLVYKKIGDKLEAADQHYSLAGYNLIYKLWEKNGKPTDQGWHVSANDLIETYSDGKESYNSLRFLIDFDPTSKWRIGIIELLDIYIYTYQGTKKNEAGWSPMMLRLRDVMYEEFHEKLSSVDKKKKNATIDIPETDDNIVEFLYMNGEDKGWNWGRNEMVNAVFLQGSARDYFRKYF